MITYILRVSQNVISKCAHETVRSTGPLWGEASAINWPQEEKTCMLAVWENLPLEFSLESLWENPQRGNLRCLECGKNSRQLRMPAHHPNIRRSREGQGCNSCGKDSGKWSHWIHLVSKDSHFSQQMHLTGLIQQSMSPETQMSLPSTLSWCPSIKNTQNNVRILKHSLETHKCRKTCH